MLPEGVEMIDHTADVALRIHAPSLEALFQRAAAGMMAIVEDEETPRSGPSSTRDLVLASADVTTLLVAWLRELLYLFQSQGLAYDDARFTELGPTRLVAQVLLRPAPHAATEIKGVTYHQLEVTEVDGEWRALVVFDV